MQHKYRIASNVEIATWSDIKHLDLYCLSQLYAMGWAKRQIKRYLGEPDYETRQGRYNTGPRKWWRADRVHYWADNAPEAIEWDDREHPESLQGFTDGAGSRARAGD